MVKKEVRTEAELKAERIKLAKGIGARGKLLKVSLIERYTVCTRKGCKCMRGEKHGPYLYLSYFDGKQSRQIYVPKSMESEVRRWTKNYRRVQEVVNKISQLNIELVRMKQQKAKK